MAAIFDIERESFSVPWSAGEFDSLIRGGRTEFFAAIDDPLPPKEPAVAGYGMVYIVKEAAAADIVNIAVAERFRRQGVATMLIGRLEDVCAAKGADNIYLEVRRGNSAARALYEKLGYRQVGVRKNYYIKPVEDAVVMLKVCYT